jgi:hypothetical protein
MAHPRRLRHGLAVVATTALALGFAAATPSLAATGTSPYTIDGTDIPDVGATEFPDASGNAQELGPVNGSGTKVGVIHSAPKPMLAYTNPNAQVDLKTAWLDSDPSPSTGDIWLYFAWERDSNRGSGFIMYEFQQDPEPPACTYGVLTENPVDQTKVDALIANCNPFENRQPGDFILAWDQNGNSTDIILRTFTAGTDTNGNGEWDKGEPLVLDAGVTVGGGNAYAAYSSDKRKGEAAVNLTQTIFKDRPGECTTVGNVIPGTVTGNSDTADYKDVVLADVAGQVTISNCGTVTITKQTVNRDGTPLASGSGTFETTLNRLDGSNITYAEDGAPALTQYVDTLVVPSDPTATHNDLIAGTNYRLAETDIAAGWEVYSIQCKVGNGTYADANGVNFAVQVGVTTTCIVKNQPANGTLVIKKVVVNDDGGTLETDDFSYSLNGAAAATFPVDGSLADGDNAANASSVSTTLVNGTAFSVTEPEADTRGYATEYDGCAGTITAGVTSTCTITNDDVAPTLTLEKTVVNDNGGDLTEADFQASIDGTDVDWDTPVSLDAGDYTASETTQPGYAAGDWAGSCAADGTVTLNVGDNLTCTITNDDVAATLTLEKTVVNDNGGDLTEADFQASIDGTDVDWDTPVPLDAGDYTASETTQPGYAAGDWAGSCAADGTVTLNVGDNLTCTITNDDQKNTPSGATVQSWVLHDSFTVVDRRQGALDEDQATATFEVFTDDECLVQVDGYSETVPVNALTDTAATADGLLVTEPDTYYWQVSFSGDNFNNGFTTTCGAEVTTIAAVDDRVLHNLMM